MSDETLFCDAIAVSDPSERAAFLNRVCPDAIQRRRIEELLAAHFSNDSFLKPPANGTATFDPEGTRTQETEPLAAVGDRVGPYKLLEKIGEGGMGEVWVADQLEPIKRRVAIKLIKAGMDSRSVLGRFEAERQALAVMDHPNIAKVLDAGTTADGRPYFVMELVKGTPITEFCDARKLTPKQRLELFIPVCQAIQHAHMKGIIHRDIKPSNVLVALHDETPVAKVIDFGVAKAIGQQLTDKTIYTGFGALVGTPAYMAPEQATFNQLDVDTRSDVYSLGVLLYELLAGSPPIEKERLKRAALDEILRIVRDEEPPRPSARLSTSQTKASIAATRGSEPTKLSQLMKGELDWIVMKALDKDRTRRYDTANGLAKDIQRYLSGDSVEACPPTLGYRLRKAYRKNRVAVRVVSAFLCLAFGAAAMGAYLAVQARRAEAVAEAKRIEAEEQRHEAVENRDAWAKANEAYLELAIEAEIRSNGARLDADLLEYKSDKRVGLLRLARPLSRSVGPLPLIVPGVHKGTTVATFDTDPDFVKLREFQVAAVISAGQEFAPLVPPIRYDRYADMLPPFSNVGPDEVSPDGRFYLGHTDRTGLQMWSIPGLNRVGLLREADERVLRFGFSPDAKTVWTQDQNSVVRFWNLDGTLRAKTPLRPDRFVYPAGMSQMQIRYTATYNRILVADGIALLKSWQRIGVKPGEKQSDWDGKPGPEGPTDLYSTRTGKFIRRLDKSGRVLSEWKISPDGRWLIYTEQPDKGDSQLVIVSAADGGELARLVHPSPQPSLRFEVSPTGRWILTNHAIQTGEKKSAKLWRCSDWQQVSDPAVLDALAKVASHSDPHFLSDDIISASWAGEDSYNGVGFPISQPEVWFKYSDLGAGFPISELNGKLLRGERGQLRDADTLQRLKPPQGRKYHPDLAKLAPDGRFWNGVDTVTEKDLPYFQEGAYFPGLGQVAVRIYGEGGLDHPRYYDDTELRMLPDPKRLDFPPELVELWAKVVVGGELSPEGTFQPWDQPTWAAKQRELAAMKPPYADFPFPGWAATEPHLWYRIRANDTKHGPEHDKYLKEWQRLTGRIRPDLGPDNWRTPEVAPKPMEPKK